ncbi:hypothetical protein PILCRDRAFT_4508 [Piloderma croceum F 1598]|uniref:C2H2-type domain-containing protein n=1 Tax=Piloderma croceum (strain F 1598) TaxID=765440 RepID=A0A0C3CA79_PILCF|nr:hypothetical protein PILCRDRAFT_4508 [Piloderma croceum F 1598]
MPRNASKDAVRVNCPECGGEYDEKSIKRHIDGHRDELNHACDYCPKRFKQRANRDVHHRTHSDEWLQCDACGEIRKQPSEMTRHKQEAHGHPRRNEKAPDSRRITHSIVILPAAECSAGKERARSDRLGRRSKPYGIPRKHMQQICRPSTSSSSFQVSFSNISTPEPSSSYSTALSAPIPSSSSSSQNSIFDIARPSSPLFNLPQASLNFSYADESYPQAHSIWPADLSGFDSQLFPTQLVPEHDLQRLWQHNLALPGAYFTQQTPFSDFVTPYTSPFNCDVPLPDGVSYFHSDVYNQGGAYTSDDHGSQSQPDLSLAQLWEALSLEDQVTVIEAHPQCLETASIAPPPSSPNDGQYPPYQSNQTHLMQTSGTAFETSFTNFSDDINGLFNFFF